ncbi:MAG: metallophosphoesterase [Planctomycetes bacterium]|nr:metallophosphoesterase [Planctomycetota bacterium]
MPNLFALSDPHLSLTGAKPMDVFGPRWDNHVAVLRDNWQRLVAADDIVLMPGDISWATRLDEARVDLEWLDALPGTKVLLRGNHDYWWESLGKMQKLGLEHTRFVQNNSVVVGPVTVGGSRLWDFPGIWWQYTSNRDNADVAEEKRNAVRVDRNEDDEKIRAREIHRLRLSLASLPTDAAIRVAMTHYPPLGGNGDPTFLTDIIGEYNIDICVFGHAHSLTDDEYPGADTVVGTTRYVMAASDYLRHEPKLLCTF